MKLHQKINQQQNIQHAVQKIYEEVEFPNGFHAVFQSMLIEGVVKSEPNTNFTHNGSNFQIFNEVGDGGISLSVEKWPYFGHKTNITILGQPDSLKIIDNIFERNGVKYKRQPISSTIKINVQYHDNLNPKLWKNEDELREDVLQGLLKIADEFFTFLDMESLPILDIIITGSSANYNWTKVSDLDLHLLVNMDDVEAEWGQLASFYFEAARKNWNDTHNVKIKGIPVEMYVQDEAEKHTSTGVYSLQSKKWITRPVHEEPSIDNTAIKTKVREWAKMIRHISKSSKPTAIEELMDKLRTMRQAGLEEAGEFSVENIAFKTLRNNGYLDLLADAKIKAFDAQLSVEEEELLRI